MKLSERIRPNSEAAPWVIEQVKGLEDQIDELRRAMRRLNEAAARVCGATSGIDVINAVAELRPLVPEIRGVLHDSERRDPITAYYEDKASSGQPQPSPR